jgi:predicted permease
MVSEGFFGLFGARPELGRLLVPDDYRSLDAIVISPGIWESVFGRADDVLGRTLVLDGRPWVVVGVMDRAFMPPEAVTGRTVDVWQPIDWSDGMFADPRTHLLSVVGRLAPGATPEAAQAEVDLRVQRMAVVTPENWTRRDGTLRDLPLVPLQEATVGAQVRQGLGLLFGAVTLLLLVACTNVAHLFLARGLARVREMAVRRALGARTRGLAAQLLVESTMVGVLGAALGVVLAWAGIAAFLSLSPDAIPRADAVRLDLRVLGFAIAIGVATSLIFGMLPALRLVGSDVSSSLHGRGRGNSDTRRDRRVRGTLVIAEVALSLMLIVQAGALLRGFARLNAEDHGFRMDVLTIPLEPRHVQEPEQWTMRMERVRAAIAAVPGVRMASYGMTTPLQWTGGAQCCWRTSPGFPGIESEEIATSMHVVDTDYIPLLDLRVVAGRPWTRAEATMKPAPVVISEPLAIQVFGSASAAVGREMTSSRREATTPFRIVGVVADNRHYGPDQTHGPAAYMPAETVPFPIGRASVAVLPNGPIDGLPARLRDAIWSVEPDLPVPAVRTLRELAGEATARARFEALLFSTFGTVALLLVAGGLYGTLLYAVGRRRRELGIRLALGDAPRRLERNVLGQGLATAAAGCALGAFGAWGLGRALESRIAAVAPGDPALLAAAVVVLFVVALTASWLPARRAARTDPLEALRTE